MIQEQKKLFLGLVLIVLYVSAFSVFGYAAVSDEAADTSNVVIQEWEGIEDDATYWEDWETQDDSDSDDTLEDEEPLPDES